MCFGGSYLQVFMKSQEKIYKYHTANLHSLEIALDNISIVARKAISEERDNEINSFCRLYSFLLGAWFETRLKKLLFEPNGFSESDRDKIKYIDNQYDKWIEVIELAFRKKYNVPSAKLSGTTLPFSTFARYKELNDIFSADIKSIIEIRNKLAHGQWIYPFNSTEDDIENGKYQLISNENLLSLQFKKKIIFYLCQIIHDLVVSKPTFERDFDKHYSNVVNTRNNLIHRNYTDYKNQLIHKRKKGIVKRKA